MTAKKRRQKDRRRARKLASQAWDAIDDGNPDRAIRIARRAVDKNPSNPVLWNDLGLLIRQYHPDNTEAARAFLAAITFAPDMAEAYANLAEVRVEQGLLREAIALQSRAVQLEPGCKGFRNRLETWQALLACEVDADQSHDEGSTPPHDSAEESHRQEFGLLARQVDSINWEHVETELTRKGFVHLRELIPREICEECVRMFDDDSRFARTVMMDKPQFGRGVYRYFESPLPPMVDAIRRLTFPDLALIANRWQRLLGKDRLFPVTWEGYRLRCAAAGQTTPTPLLLKYESGGFNDLHRDIRGSEFFPIQLVVVLSPSNDDSNCDGFAGGEFLFCDQPERKKQDRERIPAGLGDAVLFCTQSRLVQIGGVWGLKPVMHGMDRLTSGTRFALGVPYHEYD